MSDLYEPGQDDNAEYYCEGDTSPPLEDWTDKDVVAAERLQAEYDRIAALEDDDEALAAAEAVQKAVS